MNWNTGKPNECGYYLAAWVSPSGKETVSELWFNPDHKEWGGGRWWAVNGYFPEECRESIVRTQVPLEMTGVYAWAEKPKAPPLTAETRDRERKRHIHKMCIYRTGGDVCPCDCERREEERVLGEEIQRRIEGRLL